MFQIFFKFTLINFDEKKTHFIFVHAIFGFAKEYWTILHACA